MQRYSREHRAAYFQVEGCLASSQMFVLTEDSLPSFKTPMALDHDAAFGIASGYSAASRMLNERKGTEGSRTDRLLIDLLADYRDLCATESRDMVFGLLGLAKDAEHFHDLVDYSMPLGTFFVSLAQRLIDLGHGAKMLLQASNTAHTEDLPSWVPVSHFGVVEMPISILLTRTRRTGHRWSGRRASPMTDQSLSARKTFALVETISKMELKSSRMHIIHSGRRCESVELS